MCTQRCQHGELGGGGHRSAPNSYGADMWVPTLGPLFLSLVCGICIGFASDACRICVDFVGFAFLGVSKTYGNIKKAIGFIPPHLRFYNIKRGKATQPPGRVAQLMPTMTTNLVPELYKSSFLPSALSVCPPSYWKKCYPEIWKKCCLDSSQPESGWYGLVVTLFWN